jgi:hypothetical protein
MKRILIISISIISIIIVAFTFFSCSKSLIYLPDREWQYAIRISNNSEIDTVTLKTYDETWELTQRKIEYIYNIKKNSSGGYSQHTEVTGVIDRKENILTRLISTSEVWLHPPRTGNLRVTELLPFPWIKFPIKIGQSNNWELTPKDGWKEMEGMKIKGKIQVVRKIFYDNTAVKDSCWVLDGIGESEHGKYNCSYYFSEKYGFVYFFYDFNEYQIELVPIKITF